MQSYKSSRSVPPLLLFCTRIEHRLFQRFSSILHLRMSGFIEAGSINGARCTSGDVFDQAHDETLALARLDDHCRDIWLAEHLEGFQPTFAANEVISGAIGRISATYGDGPFQTDSFDVVNNFPMLALVAGAWIYDCNLADRSRPTDIEAMLEKPCPVTLIAASSFRHQTYIANPTSRNSVSTSCPICWKLPTAPV